MKSADKETYKKYKKLAEEGISQDQLIAELNDDKLSIIEAIKVIRQVFSITLGAAKTAVSSHPSWKDVVDGSQGLHDDCEEAFR